MSIEESKEPQNIPESPEVQKIQESQTEYPKRETSPKTNQIDLEKCKLDYITSNWKSIKELSDRYSIEPKTLHCRIDRENWEEERQSNLSELRKKVVKKSISIGEEYLRKTFERSEKWTSLIDKKLGEKPEALSTEALNQLNLIEQRTHELAKSALRIPDVKGLDITSKGKSLGENLVEAIERLRENDKSPALTDKEIDRIVEAEVIEEDRNV